MCNARSIGRREEKRWLLPWIMDQKGIFWGRAKNSSPFAHVSDPHRADVMPSDVKARALKENGAIVARELDMVLCMLVLTRQKRAT